MLLCRVLRTGSSSSVVVICFYSPGACIDVSMDIVLTAEGITRSSGICASLHFLSFTIIDRTLPLCCPREFVRPLLAAPAAQTARLIVAI
jgi:hypothetical protein